MKGEKNQCTQITVKYLILSFDNVSYMGQLV